VLNLGCRPGRFADLLHVAGGIVTGIDLSPGSIACDRVHAAAGLDITCRVQDALTRGEPGAYDLILHASGAISPLRRRDPLRPAGPHPPLVLTEHPSYAGDIACGQALAADCDRASAYRMGFQDVTSEAVLPVFAAGLRIDAMGAVPRAIPARTGRSQAPWRRCLPLSASPSSPASRRPLRTRTCSRDRS